MIEHFKNLILKCLAILVLPALLGASPAFAAGATLSLSPTSGTFNQGCPFTLTVNLDTGGAQTDGTDAILLFDSSRFSATKVNPGTIYSDYPGTNIDNTAGKVTISGLAPVGQTYTGQGIFATVNFNVLPNAPSGAVQVNFDFTPGSTTDSNVAQHGTVQDILSAVNNGSYTVGTGSCAQQTLTPTGAGTAISSTPGVGGTALSTTPSAQTQLKTLPQGGDSTVTWILTGVGTILTVLGILGLALL
ncbi:hypothetical protein HY389_01655 [Candidatus Daviesbacteria bacterium]|nr:hypothetical protein [Candidatus Daviesbacteria bacterium]